MIIAALSNAQIGIPSGGCYASLCLGDGCVDIAHDAGLLAVEHLGHGDDNIVVAAGTEKAVHLGKLLKYLIGMALGKAAGYKNFEIGPLLAQGGKFKYSVYGFALCRVNEAAGIYNDNIRLLGLTGLMAGLGEQIEHLFAVDKIFLAAQRDK